HDVQNDQVEGAVLAAARACVAIVGDLHLVSLHAEVVFQPECDGRLVFDYEDAWHAFSIAGSTTVKVLPLPGSLSTRMSAWCASTICSTIASPTPEPRTLPEAAALPRTNLRKIALRSWAVTPAPRSRTRMAIWPLCISHSTHTTGSLGEYLSA